MNAQRAHVVQAVGELDQQHAHVVGDRQQQLAQVLGLLGLACETRSSFLSLVRPSTSAPISWPNSWSISARVAVGVLDGVVQQRRRDGGVVELEVGQDRRDFERMGEIGIAGGALLLAMRLHGVDIGAVEQLLVGVGIVAPDPLDQFVLPHHRRLGVCRLFCIVNGLRRDLRPRSSGARARAWFCIRGRSVVRYAPCVDRCTARGHRIIDCACRQAIATYHDTQRDRRSTPRQHAARAVTKTTNGPDRCRAVVARSAQDRDGSIRLPRPAAPPAASGLPGP